MDNLSCVVVTPETTVLDQKGSFVALPLTDGEIGIAPRHAPLIARLGQGELRLQTPEGAVRFYVEGGFVEVLDDVVSVMTSRALSATQLQLDAVREKLRKAREQRSYSPQDQEAKDLAVQRLQGELRVAERHQGSRGQTAG